MESVATSTAELIDALGALSGLTRHGRTERRWWQTQVATDRDTARQAETGHRGRGIHARAAPDGADRP
jgi:hypothetical protein